MTTRTRCTLDKAETDLKEFADYWQKYASTELTPEEQKLVGHRGSYRHIGAEHAQCGRVFPGLIDRSGFLQGSDGHMVPGALVKCRCRFVVSVT